VQFDDTSGVQTTITIGAGVTVFPSSITDIATNNSFTINGAGHIGGTGNIVKSGDSTLTLATVNSFTGTVDIQGGILQVGATGALGTTTTGTTVESGATLDINGFNIGAEPITISGSGTSGQGALINNGGAISPQAIGIIILAADATIGGSGSWAQNNSGVQASLSTSGNPFNLTKVGANTITLQNLTSVDAALANIDVQQGTLAFNGITPNMGDPNATNIVEAGAIESFTQDSVNWNKNFVFNGDGTTTTIVNGTSATTELDGPIMLNGSVVFNIGGTSFTITNSVSGTGGLIKSGGTAMILTGPTTFTGDTTISAAALRLAGSADLSGSTNLIINAGATLTVTGMVSSTFPLINTHTLMGNGVINGALIANAGSTISPAVTPASSPVGILTVSNSIVLHGTTIMQLDPANGTNDVLKSGLSSITFGGTLILTNISTPAAGNSFKLFSALNSSSYLGSFTGGIVPATPGPGLAWDTSALNTSGTIKVASTVTTPVKIGSIAITGGNVVLSGSNGVPNNHYIVTTSTNIAVKFSNWTPIATNTFDANGKFSFTNSLTPPVPQQFYLLQVPGN
jgi:autotransporter-associated beta strand protein